MPYGPPTLGMWPPWTAPSCWDLGGPRVPPTLSFLQDAGGSGVSVLWATPGNGEEA